MPSSRSRRAAPASVAPASIAPASIVAAFAAALVASTAAAPQAQAASLADLPMVGSWFGPPQHALPMTEAELASLGCIGFSFGAVALTAVFGGAAAVAVGGAAPASVVAVPVLAGVAAAGCAVGSAAAPGLAWLSRNRAALTTQIGDSLPATPRLTMPAVPNAGGAGR